MTNITRSYTKLLLGVWCVFLVAAGCGESERLDPELEKLGRATGPVDPSARMPKKPMANPHGPTKIHAGEVIEAIDVPRYTYIKVKKATNEMIWAAIPQEKVSKGQSVEVMESIVMKDFESPTLKRTFPSIIFGVLKSKGGQDGGAAAQAGAATLPPGHPPVAAPASESRR